jgi:sortase (surface protein transpeptidase)
VSLRLSTDNSNNWRRRLRPAAPFLLRGGAAALLVAALVIPRESTPEEPPTGPRLSAAALAQERPITATSRAQQPQEPQQPRRRLVDVVDREAAPPRRIRIPAIRVRARVVSLEREPDRTMETPKNFDNTGWYEPGSEPGERGPAVIAGHIDSTSGPAVFYRLRGLKRGNLVRIKRADGSVVRFRVEGLERWPKAAFPTRRVFGKTRLAALRLVTCSGNFDPSTGHYVDNTIVYATRVRVRRTVPIPAREGSR